MEEGSKIMTSSYSPIRILSTTRLNFRYKRCLITLLLCFAASLAAVIYLNSMDIVRIRQIAFDLEGYTRRPEVAHIQCDRILAGDILYAKSFPRQALVPTRQLDMSCEAVRKRVLSRRNPATGFPVAFAKNVYKDYEFLEEQLSVSYSEENTFCFALDKKATRAFHRNIMNLSMCLNNVYLAIDGYELDSAGRGQWSATLDCIQRMRKREWKYVISQQNHDIILKTNGEIAEIFRAMNGSNDMELSTCPTTRCDIHEKNLGKLGLCPKNLSKKDLEDCEKQEISMAKGWMQLSLARESVDYMMDMLNTTRLISELQLMWYGMDELFVQSLVVTTALRMPGMYPARCLAEYDTAAPTNHLFITRLTHLNWWKEYICGSDIWRHNICIFGVEDLPYLAGVHHIMANKMMPDVDYGAISCIGELLYKRTHYALEDHPLDIDIYENLPGVRLQRGMKTDPTYFDRFVCPKYPRRKQKTRNQIIGEFLMFRKDEDVLPSRLP